MHKHPDFVHFVGRCSFTESCVFQWSSSASWKLKLRRQKSEAGCESSAFDTVHCQVTGNIRVGIKIAVSHQAELRLKLLSVFGQPHLHPHSQVQHVLAQCHKVP